MNFIKSTKTWIIVHTFAAVACIHALWQGIRTYNDIMVFFFTPCVLFNIMMLVLTIRFYLNSVEKTK